MLVPGRVINFGLGKVLPEDVKGTLSKQFAKDLKWSKGSTARCVMVDIKYIQVQQAMPPALWRTSRQ